jgi:hypothetical protein
MFGMLGKLVQIFPARQGLGRSTAAVGTLTNWGNIKRKENPHPNPPPTTEFHKLKILEASEARHRTKNWLSPVFQNNLVKL